MFLYYTVCYFYWYLYANDYVIHRQKKVLYSITGGSCQKYDFCSEKCMLVATNTYICRDKHIFSRKKLCHDKHIFVATKIILVAAPANDRIQNLYCL